MKTKSLIFINFILIALIIFATAFCKNETVSNYYSIEQAKLAGSSTDYKLVPSFTSKTVKPGETITLVLKLQYVKPSTNGINNVIGYMEYDEQLI